MADLVGITNPSAIEILAVASPLISLNDQN